MAIDYQQLMQWPFAAVTRAYAATDAIRFARGFGAGLPGPLQAGDTAFLDPGTASALPVIAVPLADGEFWQQDAATGIDWRQIIHAEEAITVHRPLPAAGTVIITQRIEDIFDRGAERGAVMLQKQFLHDAAGTPLVTIDVTTVLKGNGGFGGQPYVAARVVMPEDRAPDASVEIATPGGEDAIFRLSAEIKAAAQAGEGKAMMRGVGCFGLAGRGVLKLACDNDPARLVRLGVRYVGPMFTDETVRLELWYTGPGKAVFRLWAVERNALVLNNSYVEFAA